MSYEDPYAVEFLPLPLNQQSGPGGPWECTRCGCLVVNRQAHQTTCPYQVKKVNHTFARGEPTRG